MKEALAEIGDFKNGRRMNNKVRFADDTRVRLPDRNTSNINPPPCYLPVSCKSLVVRCDFLESCKQYF